VSTHVALDAPPGTVGIVVVNYGSAELIERNLGSADLDGLPVHVVVVDNFSSAEALADVSDLAARRGWQLVALPSNRGFAAGVNAGIEAARTAGCVTFLLLNPDAAVDGVVVEQLRQHSLREPLALISPRVVTSTGSVFFAGSRLFLDSGRIRGGRAGTGRVPGARSAPAGGAQEWVSGACLAVHDELLRRIGPLDEHYFLYWEDVDLSARCLAAGGTLVVREDLTAVHDAGGTQGPVRGSAKSPLYYYYNCRNRLVFAAHRLSRRQILRWMWATPAVSWEILLRGGRRQLVRQPRLAWAALRGSAAGLRVAAAAVLHRPAPQDERRGSVLVAHQGAELYGSDRMLAESVAGLVAEGHRVVVALPQDGPLVAVLEDLGATVEFCRMPVLRRSALTPRGLLALMSDAVLGLAPACRLIRRAGTDGVYVNTLTIPSWALLGWLLGRRVTTHVHEADSTDPRLVRLLLGLPTLAARRVLVNSEYCRDVLLDTVPRVRDRSLVVYNGVAGPPEVTAPRSELTGPVRLTFVGRLSPRKGPQVIVAALSELVRRGRDVRLTLAGAVFTGYEWFEEDLRRQVHDGGLQDRVDFLGFVPDVWGVLSASDVVVVPSVEDETFGNTAVEAVLAARPAVVSGFSGLREAVAGYDSVTVAAPGDVPGWVEAIEQVIAQWPAFAVRAVSDADLAGRRHDPLRYRLEVARLIGGRE
jgi:GT2 family glycosyltransferase/glycosyltransferase involved in cell wall biosynthesis